MNQIRLFPRVIILFSLLCAGVSIFLQAKWYIPVNDDYSYQFIIGENFVGSCDNNYSQKIESFGDLLISQINHYRYSNGRSVVHTIVQALIAFGGWEFVIPLLYQLP